MRVRLFCLMALPVFMVSAITRPVVAEDPNGNTKDKEAIAKNAEAFVEAFHNGDAKALAAFWAYRWRLHYSVRQVNRRTRSH